MIDQSSIEPRFDGAARVRTAMCPRRPATRSRLPFGSGTAGDGHRLQGDWTAGIAAGRATMSPRLTAACQLCVEKPNVATQSRTLAPVSWYSCYCCPLVAPCGAGIHWATLPARVIAHRTLGNTELPRDLGPRKPFAQELFDAPAGSHVRHGVNWSIGNASCLQSLVVAKSSKVIAHCVVGDAQLSRNLNGGTSRRR